MLCLWLADDPGVSLSVVTDHYTLWTATLVPHHQKLYPVNTVMSSEQSEYFKLLIFLRFKILSHLKVFSICIIILFVSELNRNYITLAHHK